MGMEKEDEELPAEVDSPLDTVTTNPATMTMMKNTSTTGVINARSPKKECCCVDCYMSGRFRSYVGAHWQRISNGDDDHDDGDSDNTGDGDDAEDECYKRQREMCYNVVISIVEQVVSSFWFGVQKVKSSSWCSTVSMETFAVMASLRQRG
jgi:hypothetical protein